MKIVHLSITAENPEHCAKILAELTCGSVKPFPSPSMDNAWMCVWNEASNELVEFIPSDYALRMWEHCARYEKQQVRQNFSASHFMLETDVPMQQIAAISSKYGLVHRFREKFGGPLYEVWLESGLLVEFSSHEIRNWGQL